MSSQNYSENKTNYDEFLEDSPVKGVQILNWEGVEIEPEDKKIEIPERYLESGIDAIINEPKKATISGFNNLLKSSYHSSKEVSDSFTNKIYNLGRSSSREESSDELDYEDLGFEVWNQDDSHVKTRYGTILGAIGLSGFALGGKGESALALGLAGTGMEVSSRYFHGKRDEEIENAREGLSQAFGDYVIEVKEEERRSDKVREKVDWVRETLDSLN